MKQLDRTFELAGAIAATVLLVSFIAEVGFELFPCLMCQLQRGTYAIFMAIASCGIGKKKQKMWLWAMILILTIGICLAIYHTFLQLGLEVSFCPGIERSVESREDFIKLLESQSCKRRSWDIFGIPASAYNGVISLSILTWIFYKKRITYVSILR